MQHCWNPQRIPGTRPPQASPADFHRESCRDRAERSSPPDLAGIAIESESAGCGNRAKRFTYLNFLTSKVLRRTRNRWRGARP